MDNVIKKLELDLDGKKVVLTLKQAKRLKESLDELFKKEVIREYWPTYQPQPYYWQWDWKQPYYPLTPWCSGSGGYISPTYCSATNTLQLAV